MSDPTDHDVTSMLGRLDGTDPGTVAAMAPEVYRELRALAGAYLRQERPDHTLQATALVHEAYVRLADGSSIAWNDRAHFFRVAARAMRRILVDHALAHKALKRGGDRRRLALSEIDAALDDRGLDLVDLDEAMERLAERDERLASLVELRFFGGCTNDEVAEALGLSTRTVEREWRVARAWLRSELGV